MAQKHNIIGITGKFKKKQKLNTWQNKLGKRRKTGMDGQPETHYRVV